MIWVFYHGPGCVPHTSKSPACRRACSARGGSILDISNRAFRKGFNVVRLIMTVTNYLDSTQSSLERMMGATAASCTENVSASGLEKNCSLDVVRGGYSENKSTIAGGLRRTVSNPKSLSCQFVKFQNWNESQRRREGLREHHRPFKMSSAAYRWLAEARLQRCRCTTIFANTRSTSPSPLVIESSCHLRRDGIVDILDAAIFYVC